MSDTWHYPKTTFRPYVDVVRLADEARVWRGVALVLLVVIVCLVGWKHGGK